MKKAGVRFTSDLFVSFDYNEDAKEMNVLIVDGAERYTGSVIFTEGAKKTTAKTGTKTATK